MDILGREPEETAMLSMNRAEWRKYTLKRFRRLELLMLAAIVSNLADLIRLGQDVLILIGI